MHSTIAIREKYAEFMRQFIFYETMFPTMYGIFIVGHNWKLQIAYQYHIFKKSPHILLI